MICRKRPGSARSAIKMCRDVCSVAGATRHEADSPHNRGFFAQQVAEGRETTERSRSSTISSAARCARRAARRAKRAWTPARSCWPPAGSSPRACLPETVRAVKQAVTVGHLLGQRLPRGGKAPFEVPVARRFDPALLFRAASPRGGTATHTSALAVLESSA